MPPFFLIASLTLALTFPAFAQPLPAIPAADASHLIDTVEPVGPGFVGKPVSLVSGAESFTRIDLTLGKEYPISIRRRYTSTSGYDSPLGYAWAHNYDKRLYTYPDNSVIIRKETGWKRKFVPSGGGFTTPAGETGTLTLNVDGTYTYTEKDGTTELYDLKGRLVKITDPRGSGLTFSYEAPTRTALTGLLPSNVNQATPLIVAYDYRLSRIEETNTAGALTGTWVNFQYNATTGRLTGLTDSMGRSVTYGYDPIGNLTSVATPKNSATYGYTDTKNKHLLTSTDEGDGVYTNTYDTYGRVSKQTHGTGVIDITYTNPRKQTKVTTTIKDSAGVVLNTQNRTLDFDDQGQVIKETDTFGNEIRYTRNSQTYITREERWENSGTVAAPNLAIKVATDFTYDTTGNVLTRTEAQGTALQKTTTNTWHPQFGKLLTETVKSVVNPTLNRVTTNSYDPKGNLLTSTETGLLGDATPYSYSTTYEYDTNSRLSKIDGPRTDVADVTTFTYDAAGNLQTRTEPLIGTTTYANYDSLGNPGTITDPNNNVTTTTYDTVGRLLTSKAPGDTSTTQYFYTTGGCSSCGGGGDRVDHIILPEGDRIDYYYDVNGKLNKITDNQNNSINYAYDSEGNKLKEEIKDPTGILQKTVSYSYDAQNRLKRITSPDSTYTENSYDSLGNRISIKDPKTTSTTSQYDALSRLTATVQPVSVTTSFGYDSNNNLTRVTDANNNATTYSYDDKGRVYRTVSPDTGTTITTYDEANNLKTRTDAKGITTTYQFDAANRLTSISFPNPAESVTYGYDTCINGKGRLCSITDQSGSITYEYTKKGQTAKETRTIDGTAHVTQYSYDQNGNTKTTTYPSGRIITYSYANNKITGILNNAATLATNITYKPYGGIGSLTYGNGINRSIGYDNQYRISSIVTGTLQNLTYTPDANGNITTITNNLDANKNKGYGYDALNRLQTTTGPWGTLTWTYDGVGNRQTENGTSYSYVPSSNKLSAANGLAYIYDTNGNTTNEGVKTYTYNQNQRLTQLTNGATSANYTYNANGQRTKKTVNGTTTTFIYDQQGQLIEEIAQDGSRTDYIYLNSQPIAKIDTSGTSYIHTDHLGTPTMMTGSTATKIWEIETKPFGDGSTITGTATLNLRFPGQYFDAETGNHYNYFRDYNQSLGRYLQSDPVGLRGGINLFTYVQNNPVNFIDQFGLKDNCIWGGVSGTIAIGIGGGVVAEVGRCVDGCGKVTFKRRTCLCFCYGIGASSGGQAGKGDSSKDQSGWNVSTPIGGVSGSGSSVTGGGYGPGAGIFYCSCTCSYK